MQLPKDLLVEGNYTKPDVFLCEVDKQFICKLETTDLQASLKFNAYSELSFSVGRTYDNIITGTQEVNPYYHWIEALRLIYLEGFGYFEIQDPEIVSDGIQEVKNVTAYSLEYNLAQKYIENLYVNTGEVNSIEVMYAEKNGLKVIEPVVLYNPQIPSLSLLHLVMEKIYGWKIGHVDSSLTKMSRMFEVSRASVYDFLTQDICEKFNCYFVFDTINNEINVYAESLITKFIGDGVKTSFILTNPYDTLNSVSIDGYKTTAYTYNSITGELVLDRAPESGAKIEVVDGSQEQWTTDVYVTFENLAQEVNISYSADDIKTVLTVKGADDLDIREVNFGLPYITDLSYYYSKEWMGQELYDAYTLYLEKCSLKQQEYTDNATAILKVNNQIWYATNRLTLLYEEAKVDSTTVGTYYVRGGTAPNYYYTEVGLPSEYNVNTTYYLLDKTGLNETKFTKLYAALQQYYYSKTSKKTEDIEELTTDFAFVTEYTLTNLVTDLKSANTTAAKDTAVTRFIDQLWIHLGSTPLDKLYYTPYNLIKLTNVEAGWDKESHDSYWLYYPVTVVLESLSKAKKERQAEIDGYKVDYDKYQSANTQISNDLLVANNFTPKQLIRLSAFLREDEYTDDNFVETDSDTIDSLMKTKQELLECGRIELSKLCEPKLAFSMDMANIYALSEFEPIIPQFQLGKLINVGIREDYIKRARLLQVDINFDDFSDFSCEFGELTNLRTPSSIHADLLANALSAGKSVASNASYWTKGSDVATSTDLKIQQGLLSAIDGLYSADQSVLINENGILLRRVLEDGSFSPHQAWLTSNSILLSDDSFETAHVGLGEYETAEGISYGILTNTMLAGYIEGSTMVGGTINIGDGTFVVDSAGNVTMKASSIEGYVKDGNLISQINQSAEDITINASKISLAGKQIDLTSDNITLDSTNFSVTKDGKITATSGHIAGWEIHSEYLGNIVTKDGVDYQTYLQAPNGDTSVNAFAVRQKQTDSTAWDTQFSVNYAGRMTAKNANITGTITATDGLIAGYNIGSGGSYDNALYKRVVGDNANYEVGMKASSGETDLAFYVKESTDNWNSSSNTFYIRNNGQLYAQNAVIIGQVNASTGKIGSWSIGDMGNYSDSIYTTFCAASTPSSSNPEYAVFMRGAGSTETTIAIGVKKRTSTSTSWNDAENPFYVRKDGFVRMDNAHITGTINSSSGKIGGFDISTTYLRNDITVDGTRYQSFIQAANGSDTTTAFGVRSSINDGDDWTYQFRVNYDGSALMRNATITGDSTIASACIPNLNADKITAGVLDVGRVPNLSADKITSGTISTDRLSSSVITTDNFSSKSLSTSNLTVASGCRFGVASEYNAVLYTSGSYTNVRAYGPDVTYAISWYALIKQAVELSASSRDIKTEIHGFDERYDKFFDSLNPQLYKYNFNTIDGYSMGYIWEDTKEACLAAGLSSNDIGALSETEAVPGGKELDKSDFIALNTWQIQKLKDRVAQLEEKLAALEA